VSSIGQQDLHRDEVVGCQAPAPAQPPKTATDREARDTCLTHDAGGSRETVGLGGDVDVGPSGAGLDTRETSGGIDDDASQIEKS
jgi:hypothetical protein